MNEKTELSVRYPDIAVRERDTRASETAEMAAKAIWHGFCFSA